MPLCNPRRVYTVTLSLNSETIHLSSQISAADRLSPNSFTLILLSPRRDYSSDSKYFPKASKTDKNKQVPKYKRAG